VTGKELRTVQGLHGPVVHATFLPDGQTLLGLSADLATDQMRVHWWDAATGKEQRHLDALTSSRASHFTFALSPDGRRAAFTDSEIKENTLEYFIRLWDLAAGREVRRWKIAWFGLHALTLSPDGRTLAGKSYLDGTVWLWETATGKERRVFAGGHRGRGRALAFSPDGTLLASGAYDTTAVVWDVAGRLEPRKGPLTAQQLEAHWAELAADDAARTDQAMRALAAVPEQAVALFRERLHPAAPADMQRLARLIAELDSDRFAVRDQAAAELAKLAELAEPALREALAAKPTAEAKRRIELLLEKAGQTVLSPTGERLQAERALEVLEHLGTPAARTLLEKLARGVAEAGLTQQAKAALKRLAQRPAGRPDPASREP
jgi:WD domain, G-beta repeat/WD40-like Beta Propeller Repeat